MMYALRTRASQRHAGRSVSRPVGSTQPVAARQFPGSAHPNCGSKDRECWVAVVALRMRGLVLPAYAGLQIISEMYESAKSQEAVMTRAVSAPRLDPPTPITLSPIFSSPSRTAQTTTSTATFVP